MKKSNRYELSIWAIYFVACVGSVSLLFYSLSYGAGFGIGAFSIAMTALCVLVPGIVVLGIHKIAQIEKLRNFLSDRKAFYTTLEVIAAVTLLFSMVMLRPGYDWNISESDAFAKTKVTSPSFAVEEIHGGYRVYLYLLRFMFLLFGNRTFAAVLLQLLLLVCAGLTMYLGVRRLGGRVAALFTLASIGFAPYIAKETCELNAFLIFLCSFGLTLICISYVGSCMLFCKKFSDQLFGIFIYLFSGVLIAFTCYLDFAGIVLLILLTGVICLRGDMSFDEVEDFREWSREDEYIKPFSKRAVEKFLVEYMDKPIVVFASVFLTGAITIWLCGGTITAMMKWAGLYTPKSFWFTIPVTFDKPMMEMMVVNALLMFGVYSFWCAGRNHYRIIWAPATILMSLFVAFGMMKTEYFNSYAFLYLLCVITAGCGISQAFARGRVKESVEETDARDEVAENTDSSDQEIEMVELEPQPQTQNPTETVNTAPIMSAAEAEAVAATPIAEEAMATAPAVAEPVAATPIAEEAMATAPAVAEPVAATPIAEESMATAPAVAEPVAATPIAEESMATAPAVAEPVAATPVAEESMATAPAVAEPVAATPIAEESMATAPAVAEPVAATPIAEESMATTPAVAEPVLQQPEKGEADTVLSDGEENIALEPVQTRDPANNCPEPIEYIENPLPLPKKHVSKVMDYDYDVPDDADFDYE